jgi:hypothetical protein
VQVASPIGLCCVSDASVYRIGHVSLSTTFRLALARYVMNSRDKTQPVSVNFKSVSQNELPKGRNGKHKTIVLQLLSDLGRLQPGQALQIPLSELPDTKENIRSALNRATKLKRIDVATSSDAEHLYVWIRLINAR